MKCTLWMAALLLAAAATCGCGQKEQGDSNATAQAAQPAAESGPAQIALKSATPQEAVTEFLEALRSGDKQKTAAMLTTKAREETAANDLVVEPPGAPNATYRVGDVDEAEGEKGTAYVSCVWSEKEASGGEQSFEVVWIVRQENAGWRIAGMATHLPDSNEPVVLNFEDLSEFEAAMRESEMAERPQSPSTPPADNPTLR